MIYENMFMDMLQPKKERPNKNIQATIEAREYQQPSATVVRPFIPPVLIPNRLSSYPSPAE